MSFLDFMKAKVPVSDGSQSLTIPKKKGRPHYLQQIYDEAHSSITNPPNVEKLTADLEIIRKKIDNAFGCEKAATDILIKRREEIGLILEKAELANKENWNYLPLSLSMFEWRDYRGLPVLAIFALDSPHFQISHNSYLGRPFSITPSLPHSIASKFNDMEATLRKYGSSLISRGRDYEGTIISATFDGVIPDDTREVIRAAVKDFGQSGIYLIAEPTFEVTVQSSPKPAPLPVDPIVVGWKNNALWYITDFDLTAIEEAALLEKP